MIFHCQAGARLMVTGHSLGGGVAAILSVLLRPQYSDIMCFSFSPPGGLLRYCISYIMTSEFGVYFHIESVK